MGYDISNRNHWRLQRRNGYHAGMSSCIVKALPVVVEQGCISEQQPVAAFVDTQGVRNTISALISAFPGHFTHAFAAKANTMRPVLELVRDAGMHCEVASHGELTQALRAGFSASEIVYDEPAKSSRVLQDVLQRGIGLNIDNFQELERVARLLESTPSQSRIGFRINPQVGAGRIGPMSTATRSSKFGVALDDEGSRDRLLQCYVDHPWLGSLHSHVGSQGIALEMMVEGIRRIVDLAIEINQACGEARIQLIDIGGGLPVNFDSDVVSPTFAEFSGLLEQHVPELFSGEFAVKTEFGRSVLAKNGFMVTKVEYTKVSGGRPIAITHAGAQVAARTVFMPEHWKIRLSAFDREGAPRTGKAISQDIAGPLCFAGDMIGYERELPRIEPGDLVVMHDTGAYYFSIPFYYNALPAPPVYALHDMDSKTVRIECWRKQQSLDDMLGVIG